MPRLAPVSSTRRMAFSSSQFPLCLMAWCRQCKSCATIRSYYRAPPATEGIPMKIRSPRHHALPLLLATALAPLAASAQDVDITYQSFTLDNGLRVVVHEDHKAPIVAVNVCNHVGRASCRERVCQYV